MKFTNSETWQPIQNPDITRRTCDEWANIYGIKLITPVNGFWNEYEWAYNFDKLNYMPNIKDEDGFPNWDAICDKELRAQFLKRDLFLGADLGEKQVLKEKYIETQWIRNHTMRV